MGLTQDFTGSIEPDDPAWLRADSAAKRRYYDAAGMIILDELAKQLGKGVGRNGRAMKVRIQPVLADGADGPVMEPHYTASRVITLADYAATDHGLKLFWHAGTGHRTHRKARSKGQKATPFGQILQYHADGLVPRAPVRDVRLCAARIQNVRNKLKPVWRGLLKTGRFAPAPRPEKEKRPGPRLPTAPTPPTPATAPSGPKRVDLGHEVPGPPHPHPTPAPKPPEAPKAPTAPKFVPGHLNPPPTLYTGEHPTPTHPIPVVTKVPKSRVKGPIFVVSGGGGRKAKAPAPKPAPKPPILPAVKAPIPRTASKPVLVSVAPAEPLPAPWFAPRVAMAPVPAPPPKPTPVPAAPAVQIATTPIQKSVAYARSLGLKVEPAGAAVIRSSSSGSRPDAVPAAYSWKNATIYINEDNPYWKDPKGWMEAVETGWFSTSKPTHPIIHETAHSLHNAAIGDDAYNALRGKTMSAELKALIVKEVSGYAAKNPLELVAEMYTGMKFGKLYDPRLLKLYETMKGPKP